MLCLVLYVANRSKQSVNASTATNTASSKRDKCELPLKLSKPTTLPPCNLPPLPPLPLFSLSHTSDTTTAACTAGSQKDVISWISGSAHSFAMYQCTLTVNFPWTAHCANWAMGSTCNCSCTGMLMQMLFITAVGTGRFLGEQMGLWP